MLTKIEINKDQGRGQKRSVVWWKFRGHLWGQVKDEVEWKVFRGVLDQVEEEVWDQVQWRVWDQIQEDRK